MLPEAPVRAEDGLRYPLSQATLYWTAHLFHYHITRPSPYLSCHLIHDCRGLAHLLSPVLLCNNTTALHKFMLPLHGPQQLSMPEPMPRALRNTRHRRLRQSQHHLEGKKARA